MKADSQAPLKLSIPPFPGDTIEGGWAFGVVGFPDLGVSGV